MKEIVFVVVLELSLDLRIGCEFWSLWIAVWRCEMFGVLEERRASTAMPVPPGTALHQLYSVPPTGLPFGSTLWVLSLSIDMLAGKNKCQPVKSVLPLQVEYIGNCRGYNKLRIQHFLQTFLAIINLVCWDDA